MPQEGNTAMRLLGISVAVLLSSAPLFAAPAVIDNAALRNEADGHNWPAYGRTFTWEAGAAQFLHALVNIGGVKAAA